MRVSTQRSLLTASLLALLITAPASFAEDVIENPAVVEVFDLDRGVDAERGFEFRYLAAVCFGPHGKLVATASTARKTIKATIHGRKCADGSRTRRIGGVDGKGGMLNVHSPKSFADA